MGLGRGRGNVCRSHDGNKSLMARWESRFFDLLSLGMRGAQINCANDQNCWRVLQYSELLENDVDFLNYLIPKTLLNNTGFPLD